MTEHPSKFELERRFFGEPDDGIDAHLATCPVCQGMVEQMKSERAALLERKPASLFVQQLATRAQNDAANTRKRNIWRRPAVAFGGVLCLSFCILMMVVFVYTPAPPETSGDGEPANADSTHPRTEITRWMGADAIVKIHVRRNEKTFVSDGSPFKSGDQLRYEIAIPGTTAAYVSVFAVQDGEVFHLLPEKSNDSPFSFTERLVVPGSVVIEDGNESVELLLFVKKSPYSLSSLQNEIAQRLQLDESLTGMEGLVHRMDASPLAGVEWRE